MATGRDALNAIRAAKAAYAKQHGREPIFVKLPVRMAHDLEACNREDLGDLSERLLKEGIPVFEKEGFLGMQVEIVRDPTAELRFE